MKFILLGLLLSSCVARTYGESSKAAGVVAGSWDLPPVDCGAGFPMTMHLHADEISDKVTFKDTQLKWARAELTPAERVDFLLCGSVDGSVTIKRLEAIRRMGVGAWLRPSDALTPENESYREAFAGAIGDGDYSKIEIPFVNKTLKAPSFLLKGWKTASGVSFLTLSAYDVKSGKPLNVIEDDEKTPVDFQGFNSVVFGQLKEGAAFDAARDCAKNQRRKSFDFDDVSLQIGYCYRGNHAVYISYEFSTLDLVDKKTGETLHLATKDEVERVLKVTNTHHSLTDEFTVATVKGSYNISSKGFVVTYPGRAPKTYPLDCDRVYNCGVDKPLPLPM
jgi:hypothetical protein